MHNDANAYAVKLIWAEHPQGFSVIVLGLASSGPALRRNGWMTVCYFLTTKCFLFVF